MQYNHLTKQSLNILVLICLKLLDFRVKLEGQDTKSLHVRGVLVDRAIEVLSLETEEQLGCVQFGEAYYGSDKTECAILFNNGPEPVNFVAVLDEDAIAQEMVSSVNHGCICYIFILKNQFEGVVYIK